MELKEFVKTKRDTERGIREFIARTLNDFKLSTGVDISAVYIGIDRVDVSTVSAEERAFLHVLVEVTTEVAL